MSGHFRSFQLPVRTCAGGVVVAYGIYGWRHIRCRVRNFVRTFFFFVFKFQTPETPHSGCFLVVRTLCRPEVLGLSACPSYPVQRVWPTAQVIPVPDAHQFNFADLTETDVSPPPSPVDLDWQSFRFVIRTRDWSQSQIKRFTGTENKLRRKETEKQQKKNTEKQQPMNCELVLTRRHWCAYRPQVFVWMCMRMGVHIRQRSRSKYYRYRPLPEW